MSAGWKIAAIKPEMQQALRTDAPIYGRVFEQHILPSPATFAFSNLCSPIPRSSIKSGSARIYRRERSTYTVEEVTDAVASLHPGIELAECRFIHDEQFPPTRHLADGAGSATLIYGPAIEDWQTRDIARQDISLYCDGERAARAQPQKRQIIR